MSWTEIDRFLVKEHVGLFKAASNFDVFDLNTGDQVFECREPNLGLFTRVFRFTDQKRLTPFQVEIRDMDGNLVVEVSRGIAFFLSHVRVHDGNGAPIGAFKQKLFSIGGAFNVLDTSDNVVCELKGKWTSWDFRFVAGEQELARVTKKWSGLGKELLTSADNYVLEISDAVPRDSAIRKLIFAAVMCIDFVLKE